jgi:hypothetical protein
MAPTTRPETAAAEQRRLTKAILALGESIDKEQVGPRRLEMLRAQAALSDKREALHSTRV